MASQSEVGHARNVANLQKLIQQIKAYTLYNPPVPNTIDHIPGTQKKTTESSVVSLLFIC